MPRSFHHSPAHTARYGRYGGCDPLAPPLPLQAALEAIGQEVMSGT